MKKLNLPLLVIAFTVRLIASLVSFVIEVIFFPISLAIGIALSIIHRRELMGLGRRLTTAEVMAIVKANPSMHWVLKVIDWMHTMDHDLNRLSVFLARKAGLDI